MYSYRSNLECLFRWMASIKMDEASSASLRGTKRKMAEEGSRRMSKVEKVEMKRKEDKSIVEKEKKDEVNFE